MTAPRTVSDLPADAPLAGRCLHAALAWCSSDVVADVRGGRELTPRVRRALSQHEVARTAPTLKPAEVRRGAEYLRRLHATRGDVL